MVQCESEARGKITISWTPIDSIIHSYCQAQAFSNRQVGVVTQSVTRLKAIKAGSKVIHSDWINNNACILSHNFHAVTYLFVVTDIVLIKHYISLKLSCKVAIVNSFRMW